MMTGRSVVVTGASSGIGRALALLLARRQARVTLVARGRERLDALAEEMRGAAGGDVMVAAGDAAVEADVDRVIGRALERFGRIDAVVHSAGRGLRADLVDIATEDWRATIDVNFSAAFLWARAAARHMIARGGGGHLLFVSSMAGLVNVPGYAAYCSSKHALTSFARCIRPELRRHGIRVSLLHPYKVDTPFFDDYAQRPDSRQMLDPEHIARHALALLEGRRLEAAAIRTGNLGRRALRALRGGRGRDQSSRDA